MTTTRIRFVVEGLEEPNGEREDAQRLADHQASDLSLDRGTDVQVFHRLKRVNRACNGCKLKKVRCSGTVPCAVCKKKALTCVYNDRETITPMQPRPPREPGLASSLTTARSSPPAAFSSIPSVLSNNSETAAKRQKLPTVNTHRLSKPSGALGIPAPQVRNFHTGDEILIRQPYFRWLGATSVAPPASGVFRLLSVNLAMSNTDQHLSTMPSLLLASDNSAENIHSAVDNELSRSFVHDRIGSIVPKSPSALHLHTDRDGTERKFEIPSTELIDIFYKHLISILPFLPREELDARICDGVAGECMLYAMAALAENIRVTPAGSLGQSVNNISQNTGGESLGEVYAERAKTLLIPHLSLPSVETVYALLLIAYHEFADDRDSGLWSWCGLAIRMSFDLGLHKSQSSDLDIDSSADAEQAKQRRRVFWAVFCLDRMVSYGTGRVTTIPLDQIEHEIADITTGEVIRSTNGQILTDPFPYLCRLLVILGRVSDLLNSYAGKIGNTTSTRDSDRQSRSARSFDIQAKLAVLQKDISDFHMSLPPDLVFDVHNFQAFAQTAHAQCFLLLHTWNHALILAVYHPKLVYPRSVLDIPGLYLNPNADLTRTSAISIADMVAFAELISADSFLSNPFISRPVLMAGCASLSLWHTLSLNGEHGAHGANGQTDQQQAHGSSAAAATVHRSFLTCQSGLRRLQRRWRGVSWLCSVLDSLEKQEPDVDLSMSAARITTRDMGFVKRASLDEATRQWIADELDQESVLGVALVGMTTETVGPVLDKRISTTEVSGSVSFQDTYYDVPTTGIDALSTMSNIAFDKDASSSLPVQAVVWNIDGPLRNLLIGNMSLDEFLMK
ncbi:fungal-specific transcription factor domain-containing protein [Limtongia smithiae]|uniref:fungal-specific transcription factor domain-containing protein n=1 Tax=Limtongia smithiae TaxID=1125753 RepID=UPI0034CDFDE9